MKTIICIDCNIKVEAKSLNKKLCVKCKHIRDKKYWRHYSKTKRKPLTYEQKEKRKIAKRLYSKNNRDKINAQKKAYYHKNKEKISMQQKKAYKRNRDRIKQYRLNNRLKINAWDNKYRKERNKKDINFKLKNNLRRRLYQAIKKNSKSGSAVKDLGCSINKLKQYLESQFTDNMSWKSYGRNGWHIDHIKPLSAFDLTDRQQLLKACHYSNLRPLWGSINCSLGGQLNVA